MNYIHTDENAIYYECGYSCDNAIFLSLGQDSYFFTDSRYEMDANANIKNTSIIISNNILAEATKKILNSKIKKLTIDPKEFTYYDIRYILDNTKVKLILQEKLSHKKRVIKTQKEIKLLSMAAKIGSEKFKEFAKWIDNNQSILTLF